MDNDVVPVFEKCPRCADRGYESLETYGHCVNCFYSEEFDGLFGDNEDWSWRNDDTNGEDDEE